jgi:lysine 2,3-aminomutase
MDWENLLRNGFHRIDEVQDILHIDDAEASVLDSVSQRYPMFVNSYYFSLIDPNDPDDPIRKMAIPTSCELEAAGDEDTSGEASNTVLPGMQHKYRETAIILSTSRCSMYCRHCFRKRMVGLTDDEIAEGLPEMREYVLAHPAISNLLISGGDSLLNDNDRIEDYLSTFCDLDQLDFIRFGTRVPVVLPQRITSDGELQGILARYASRKQLYVVTQFNHPHEVTSEAAEAVRCLMGMGIVVRNQTVLLKGVNDTPEVLGQLMRDLTACGVVPYYVFQCRPTRGVLDYFQVPLLQGIDVVDGARELQNGLGKCFRYVMSCPTGKIEVLGKASDGRMVFKYHQAKDLENANQLFTQEVEPGQCWLPDR